MSTDHLLPLVLQIIRSTWRILYLYYLKSIFMFSDLVCLKLNERKLHNKTLMTKITQKKLKSHTITLQNLNLNCNKS